MSECRHQPACPCAYEVERLTRERDLYKRQVEVRYGKAEEQIERLTRERDEAKRYAQECHNAAAKLNEDRSAEQRRAEAAESREAEARAVLREIETVEHANGRSTWRACPVCRHMSFGGRAAHFGDCRLAAVLGRVTGGEEG